MSKLSPQLTRLLLIRGLARAVAPVAVIWGIVDWYLIDPLAGLIFAALTVNYVIVYALTWVAPHLLNGPWRVRPIQTLILLANAVVLPIVFRRTHGVWPWGFILITILFFVSLYVATAIYFYLQDKSPMAALFAARRAAAQPPTSPPPQG